TLRDFLAKLRETKEDGASLLDRTMVFFSSNLGDASTHGVKNMPVVLAGGGFRHGQHLAFDQKHPPPLSNLYVSMLQRLGIGADGCGSGRGPLRGLETVGGRRERLPRRRRWQRGPGKSATATLACPRRPRRLPLRKRPLPVDERARGPGGSMTPGFDPTSPSL